MEKEIPNPYVKEFIEKYHPTEEQLKEMKELGFDPYEAWPQIACEESYYALVVSFLTDVLKDFKQAEKVMNEWQKKYPNQDPPYDGPEYLA